jgi:DNA repair exonuclease SbcCD nuclease subunit
MKPGTHVNDPLVLLYLTDTQFQGATPSGRTDSFMETCLRKIQEVAEIVEAENVRAIIHGGDFFNSPSPSFGVVSAIIDACQAAGCQWYVNPGNHDLFAYNLASIRYSALGLLRTIHDFNILIPKDGNKGLIFLDKMPDGGRVMLGHAPFLYGLENPADAFSFRRDEFKGLLEERDMVLMTTHGTLTTKAIPAPHVLLKDLETDAEITFGAHWHEPWGVLEESERMFVHPGSFLRMSRTETHRPSVALLKIWSRGDWDVSIRPLGSAAPASEVFRPAEAGAEGLAVDEDQVRALLDSVRELSLSFGTASGLDELLRTAARQLDVPRPVLEKALELVAGEAA